MDTANKIKQIAEKIDHDWPLSPDQLLWDWPNVVKISEQYAQSHTNEVLDTLEEMCNECIDAWYSHEHGDTVGCAIEHFKKQIQDLKY